MPKKSLEAALHAKGKDETICVSAQPSLCNLAGVFKEGGTSFFNILFPPVQCSAVHGMRLHLRLLLRSAIFYPHVVPRSDAAYPMAHAHNLYCMADVGICLGAVDAGE